MKLDHIDLQLIELLQQDAKANIKEVAETLNMTKTPVYERIKRLENEGVIEKYVAVVNSDMIGHNMVIYCSVSLESQKLDEIKKFAKAINEMEEVMECYLMGGVNDFLLKVIVKDLNHYHLFSSGKLAALPNVAQIKSTFVLNNIKKSTVLPSFR